MIECPMSVQIPTFQLDCSTIFHSFLLLGTGCGESHISGDKQHMVQSFRFLVSRYRPESWWYGASPNVNDQQIALCVPSQTTGGVSKQGFDRWLPWYGHVWICCVKASLEAKLPNCRFKHAAGKDFNC